MRQRGQSEAIVINCLFSNNNIVILKKPVSYVKKDFTAAEGMVGFKPRNNRIP